MSNAPLVTIGSERNWADPTSNVAVYPRSCVQPAERDIHDADRICFAVLCIHAVLVATLMLLEAATLTKAAQFEAAMLQSSRQDSRVGAYAVGPIGQAGFDPV